MESRNTRTAEQRNVAERTGTLLKATEPRLRERFQTGPRSELRLPKKQQRRKRDGPCGPGRACAAERNVRGDECAHLKRFALPKLTAVPKFILPNGKFLQRYYFAFDLAVILSPSSRR